MTEDIINALVKIANHKRVKEEMEPNLMWHDNVRDWQVKRILRAQELLQNEWEVYQDTRGTIQ